MIRPSVAFFASDPGYSYEREYTALYDNTQNIGDDYTKCSGKGGEHCQKVALFETYNLARLFSLEKHSRVLFDGLYQAEVSLFDDYRSCKASSSSDDFTNIEGCANDFE